MKAALAHEFTQSFNSKDRAVFLEQAQDPETVYDLCVVGGGITGAAIARDAAQRGFKILLLEKNDFAFGTSSRSSKLVHGGVRYLENMEFGLVFEATRERARLWKLAPQLTHPIPFLFPAFKKSRVPLWKLNLGLWLYDILAMFRTPSLHKKFSRRKLKKVEPALRQKSLKGAIFYWDGATDDARLTLANVMDAYLLGATPLSYVQATGVEWNQNVGETSKASHRVLIRDEITGSLGCVRARSIVSAVGPWTDKMLEQFGRERPKPLMAPTRGSHIVVKKEKLPVNNAVVIVHPTDQRVLFAIPWGEFTVLGTTDIYDGENPDMVHCRNSEIQYLIDAARDYFPDHPLKIEDVRSTWSGLRPLVAPQEAGTGASDVSREHFIEFEAPGFVYITGGKLTTHREMAREALDALIEGCAEWRHPMKIDNPNCQTHKRAFPHLGFPKQRQSGIGSSEASRLIEEDIVGILRTQMVLSLSDFMIRRTEIYYKEEKNGLDLLSTLEPIFCRELEWSQDRWNQEKADYETYVKINVDQALGR